MDMEEPKDEFEKYFLKSSHAANLRNEELLRRGSLPESNKKNKNKNKDRRGSSYRQPNHNEHNSHKQARKSICNPTGEGLLMPQVNICDASSLPNSRQGSFKLSKARSAKDIQSELLNVSCPPQRRASLTPEEVAENKLKEIKQLENENFFVVRSFLTSPQGLVNRGDSFKKKPHHSESSDVKERSNDVKPRRLSEVARGHRASVHSTSSATISDVINANASAISDPIKLETTEECQFTSRPSIEITRCFFPDELPVDKIPEKPVLKRVLSHESPHNIVVLGENRVGKTSIVTQFLTSEHLAGLDTTSHDSAMDIDRTISVSVDGVETLLNFLDVNIKDFKELEDFPHGKEFSAFLVVYSITDASSFRLACNFVKNLCSVDEHGISRRTYSVIMVANKGDLVRNRKVLDSDARDFCNKCGCKFIEVSAGLNHRTDELLVGVVCQVRLNDKRKELQKNLTAPLKASPIKSSNFLGWFKKLFGLKSKTEDFQCDDMHSL